MKELQDDPAVGGLEHSWSRRLVLWAVVLTLANVLADLVIGSPMMVLPQLIEHFDTDQAAWLTAGAMLAGAIWSPLLAKVPTSSVSDEYFSSRCSSHAQER
ncbi:hypothetical protein [Mycolicibacterium sp. YH-1]|uniref:hypothetical protein n=1 Tax=Mycolicibacterium sp. YH-1 TaxID=2908837 RepID=UPI001F4C3366|nr:hypothetical protein [Mycolicibacterium sp. YH-1]UNB52964.1 hypothetical protein L0M16_00820 [Mycolicibacterium sp. YH-1]